jgi:hypothetical protein
MGFLYYLPNVDAAGPEVIAEAGLTYALPPDRPITHTKVQANGPDNGRGVLVADGKLEPALVRIRPEVVWTKGGVVWIGHDPENLATPESLLRVDPLPGDLVRMADQREWIIPKARAWSGDESAAGWVAMLPTVGKLDDEGKWTSGGIVKRYQHLWDLAARWFDSRLDSLGGQEDEERELAGYTVAEMFDAVCELLVANYRLSRQEVSILGLLDTSCAARAMDSASDWAAFVEYQSKKVLGALNSEDSAPAPATSSSNDGPGG